MHLESKAWSTSQLISKAVAVEVYHGEVSFTVWKQAEPEPMFVCRTTQTREFAQQLHWHDCCCVATMRSWFLKIVLFSCEQNNQEKQQWDDSLVNSLPSPTHASESKYLRHVRFNRSRATRIPKSLNWQHSAWKQSNAIAWAYLTGLAVRWRLYLILIKQQHTVVECEWLCTLENPSSVNLIHKLKKTAEFQCLL